MVLARSVDDIGHGLGGGGCGTVVGDATPAHGHANGGSFYLLRLNAAHGGRSNCRIRHRCVAHADVLPLQVQRAISLDSCRQL